MMIKTSRILLIAETLIGVSCLAACLKGWECSIHFTISREEANTLVRKQQFDIVLSEFGFWNESSHPLAALLIGSDTTLVYSYPVETGCWWLPAVKNGQSCWGSLAVPPSELIDFLNDILQEKGARKTASMEKFGKATFKGMAN
jgi:hypothetical protein